MSSFPIDLNALLTSPEVDSISGREFGSTFAERQDLLTHVRNHDKIVLLIDENKVKAINDSFIKGFFKGVFELLKSKRNVQAQFEIKSNDYYKRLFDKNWTILEAIYASA